MEKLIKNGDIILDGTLPRYAKEKQAFEKLEYIEGVLEKHNIPYEKLDGVLEVASWNTIIQQLLHFPKK